MTENTDLSGNPMLFAQLPHDCVVKSYRPSNGTDGDIFYARFCAHCEAERLYREDANNDPCQILLWAMAVSINDPNYPAEWIEDGKGPRCTAFEEEKPND